MALSREDWIWAALFAIAEGRGTAGVAVEPLAARLGATKGSFYWHFRNREALIQEALAKWERESTDDVIARLESVTDPTERLRLVLSAAMDEWDQLSMADVALLAAAADPLVAPVAARVQRKRMAFLERCFKDMGLGSSESRQRARLAYSAYLGWFQQRLGQADGQAFSERERAAYQRTVIKLLTTR